MHTISKMDQDLINADPMGRGNGDQECALDTSIPGESNKGSLRTTLSEAPG